MKLRLAWTRRVLVRNAKRPPLPMLPDDLWGMVTEFCPEPAWMACATRLPDPVMPGIMQREVGKLLRHVTIEIGIDGAYIFYFKGIFWGSSYVESVFASAVEHGRWSELLDELRHAWDARVRDEDIRWTSNVNLPLWCMDPKSPHAIEEQIIYAELLCTPIWEYSFAPHLSVLECYSVRLKNIEWKRAVALWDRILDAAVLFRKSHPHILDELRSVNPDGVALALAHQLHRERFRPGIIRSSDPGPGIHDRFVVAVQGDAQPPLETEDHSDRARKMEQHLNNAQTLFPPYRDRKDEIAAYRELLHQTSIFGKVLFGEPTDVEPFAPCCTEQQPLPRNTLTPRLARRNGKRSYR